MCVGIKTLDATFHLDLCLLLFTHRDKVLCHVSHVHHAGRVLEDIVLFLLDYSSYILSNDKTNLGEAEDIKGFICKLHVLSVVDGRDGDLDDTVRKFSV